MKKILLMLTAAMLTLTACQQKESFDFLVGENTIAVDFDYSSVIFEDTEAENLYTQAVDVKREAWEEDFLQELNDELEDIFITAQPYTIFSSANYVFEVSLKDVSTKGFTSAEVRVIDKKGTVQQLFTIKTHKELGKSFLAAVFDSVEDLAEELGHRIKRGYR